MAFVMALRKVTKSNKLQQAVQCFLSTQVHHLCPLHFVSTKHLMCSSANNVLLHRQLSSLMTNSGVKVKDLIPGRKYSTDNDFQQNKKEKSKIYFFRQDRQECVELFRSILQENDCKQWGLDDWMKTGNQLNEHFSGSWEVLCMHTLMLDCNLEMGRSLMKHLEIRGKPLGPVVTTFYIGLLGRTCSGNREQEDELKKYYDRLVSVTDVFDAASIEILTEALSYTKYYKECVNLLEMCKLTSLPGAALLSNVLMGALRNCDNDLCSLTLGYFESSIAPTQLIRLANSLIDIAMSSNNVEGLRLLMDFMQKHSVYITEPQLEEVIETFQRNEPGQWKGSFGFANFKSGRCTVCGHKLPRLQISDDNFNAMQSAFLEQVIISDNIFYKTSPKEIQSFIKFVDDSGPFDIVIDGMNALFSATQGKINKQMIGECHWQLLERLVHYFCDQDKRVLVLGSRMLRPYVKTLGSFRPRPAVFMASTTRADDAFFLYAALQSGKNTLIVSSDKLRDHKFRLQPDLRHIFHKWLTSIQIYNFVNPRTGIINLKRHQFELGPEEDEHGWHMPVNDADMKRAFGRQAILCLRHGPENFPLEKRNQYKNKNARSQDFVPNKEWFEL